MRLFSVTEEMLPVDPVVLQPASLKAKIVLRYGRAVDMSHLWDLPTQWSRPAQTETALSVGLLGGQIHVAGPTQSSVVELVETIRIGRALADRAARTQERRAVALGSPVFPYARLCPEVASAHSGPEWGSRPRNPSMGGFHMHVAVESPEEGVQVLDRLRVWLPVLLALSTNSPFWDGRLTRFCSHRYFAGSRWPAPGPSEIFGSVEEYERQLRHLTHPAAARFAAAANLDAQLSDTCETVDVLIADVCMDAEHAGVLAALTRALVEVMARQWRQGSSPVPASVAQLRTSTWLAALNGLDSILVSPSSGRECPVGDVVTELLKLVHPVLVECDEAEDVEAVVGDMLKHRNGSRRQRDAYAVRHDPHDVVEAALRATHDPNHSHGVPGAILAEAWALLHTEQMQTESFVG